MLGGHVDARGTVLAVSGPGSHTVRVTADGSLSGAANALTMAGTGIWRWRTMA